MQILCLLFCHGLPINKNEGKNLFFHSVFVSSHVHNDNVFCNKYFVRIKQGTNYAYRCFSLSSAACFFAFFFSLTFTPTFNKRTSHLLQWQQLWCHYNHSLSLLGNQMSLYYKLLSRRPIAREPFRSFAQFWVH